jgi:hypothetical protein
MGRWMCVLFCASATTLVVSAQGPPRQNFAVHGGYSMTRFAGGLDFPTSIALSADSMWVGEAGFPPLFLVPKIRRIGPGGAVTTILSADQLPAGTLMGPLTDITFHAGMLWVLHRQAGANGWAVGALSKFNPAKPVSTFTTVITNLPAAGDHYAEELVFDSAGRGYFSIGTATNTSVVGPDNWFVTGWLKQFPNFHGFAPVQLTLNGTNFQTPVPFPLDPTASKFTGSYMPFGMPVTPGAINPRSLTSVAAGRHDRRQCDCLLVRLYRGKCSRHNAPRGLGLS